MGRHYDDDDPAYHLTPPRRRGRRGGWGILAPQIYGPFTVSATPMAGAACAEGDPELFFDGRNKTKTAAAKRICLRCPLRKPCLAEALTPNEVDGSYPSGVWGATTDTDRERIRTHQDVPRAAAS